MKWEERGKTQIRVVGLEGLRGVSQSKTGGLLRLRRFRANLGGMRSLRPHLIPQPTNSILQYSTSHIYPL